MSQGTVSQGTVSQGTAAGTAEGDASFTPMRGHGFSQPEFRALETDPDLAIEVTPAGQRILPG